MKSALFCTQLSGSILSVGKTILLPCRRELLFLCSSVSGLVYKNHPRMMTSSIKGEEMVELL